MINLIPPTAKKNLVKEYWIRVFSVWLLLGSVAMLLGASVLFPAYFLANAKIKAYAETAAAATEKVEDFKLIADALETTSVQSRIIVEESKLLVFSNLVELFQSLEGDSIQINQIHISRQGKEMNPAKIIGVAKDRESLAAFKDRLSEQEIVLSADLPISSLAQNRDIAFEIEVTFNKQQP